MTIALTGATGATGGATAAALSAAGLPFRALTRRPGIDLPAGGTEALADLREPDAVRAALRGVRAAYLVTPSAPEAEDLQKGFIDAAVAEGVEHIVLLSQYAAASDSPVRFLRYHANVEQHLAESGIPATVLRPNLFMQGLLMFGEQIRGGILPAPIGDARVSVVDVRDIGAVAAAALAGEPRGVLDITGPEALSHGDLAETIGRTTGRRVEFVDLPPGDFADAVRPYLPEWQVDGLVEDYAHYARGEAAPVSPDVRAVLERAPISFEQFARDHAVAFGG